MPDLAEIEVLGAIYTDKSIAMSGMTYGLLLSAFTFLSQAWRWDVSGMTPTAANKDRINEIVDQAMVELMQNQRVGEIITFLGSTPTNVLLCDGATYAGVDYPELFALIDTAFISGSNFVLPDLRGRSVVGAGAGGSLTTRNIGDVGGAETHALSSNELAIHPHGMNAAVSILTHGGFVPVTDVIFGAGGTTLAAGGGIGHNNMPPFAALNYGVVAR